MTAYLIMGAIILALGVWVFFSIKGAVAVRKELKEKEAKIIQMGIDMQRIEILLQDRNRLEIERREKVEQVDEDSSIDANRDQLNELFKRRNS